MAAFAVDWVDAFSARAFGGNGCAVVHDAAALDRETCCRFVQETSLVECTFLEPSDCADVKVRYFIASREIPFAGHPTIATVASMAHRGLITGNKITLETGAGLVPVELSRDQDDQQWITMQQVAPKFGTLVDPELVAAVGSISSDDIIAPPQLVSTGLGFTITVLRDQDALRRARLDVAALSELTSRLGHGSNDMYEPFWVTLEGATKLGDTFSRLLLAPPSPPEDPFTGSATGAMAAYLWKNGLITKPEFIAEQGHDMGRPGSARVRCVGSLSNPQGVELSGQAHVLMSGDLYI